MRITALVLFLANAANCEGYGPGDELGSISRRVWEDDAAHYPTESPFPSPSPSSGPSGTPHHTFSPGTDALTHAPNAPVSDGAIGTYGEPSETNPPFYDRYSVPSATPSDAPSGSDVPSNEPSKTINPSRTPTSTPTYSTESPTGPTSTPTYSTGSPTTTRSIGEITPAPVTSAPAAPTPLPSPGPSPGPTPAPTPAPTPLAVGTCGDGKIGNGVCSGSNLCCSSHGWCGVTPDHCKEHPATPSPVPPPTLTSGLPVDPVVPTPVVPAPVAPTPVVPTRVVPAPVAPVPVTAEPSGSSIPSSEPSELPTVLTAVPVAAPADGSVGGSNGEDGGTGGESPSESGGGRPSAPSESTPSSVPSGLPSSIPSSVPSSLPSDAPSDLPSALPSDVPSDLPSSLPSDVPSDLPSSLPSELPSDIPSLVPGGESGIGGGGDGGTAAPVDDSVAEFPSSVPSSLPSDVPSDLPSSLPSELPSDLPSLVPGGGSGIGGGGDGGTAAPVDDNVAEFPSSVPSSLPSDIPSSLPSNLPSDTPSSLPSSIPSSIPSSLPSSPSRFVEVTEAPGTASPLAILPLPNPTASPPVTSPVTVAVPLPTASPPVTSPVTVSVPVPNPTASPPVTSPVTTSVPATSIPATSVPATPVPDTSAPDTSAPDTSVPDTSVPETSAPVTSAPVDVVPAATSAPVSSAPVSSVPTEVPGLAVSAFTNLVIPSRSLMNVPNQRVFQTTALDFVNNNLPPGSFGKITAIMVIVTQQTLAPSDNRRLRRSLQEKPELEVEFDVRGKIDPEHMDKAHYGTIVSNIFTDNEQGFMDSLAASSSFFRSEFAYAAELQRSIEVSAAQSGSPGNGDDETSSTLVPIIGAVVGVSLIAIIALLFLIRRRSRTRDYEDDADDDLLSWSTTSPVSVTSKDRGSFQPMQDMPSPSDSEVYEESDDDENNSDRYANTGGLRLSPIAEDRHAKLEECDVNTPRNETTNAMATPRGTKFMQVDFSKVKPGDGRKQSNDGRTRNNQKGKKSIKTGGILGDLVTMEGEWEGQLDSKVSAASETPRQNNLEKFKRGTRHTVRNGNIEVEQDDIEPEYLCASPRVGQRDAPEACGANPNWKTKITVAKSSDS